LQYWADTASGQAQKAIEDLGVLQAQQAELQEGIERKTADLTRATAKLAAVAELQAEVAGASGLGLP